jgi:hypothetical protein
VADHDAGDALADAGRHEVQQVLRVLFVEGRGGLVEDEELDLLGQRLGDLDELLLADADVLDLGVGVLAQPTRASSSAALLALVLNQSMTPREACSLPRKMFSAIESSGMSASSWWMMTIPHARCRGRWRTCQLALEEDLAVVGAVGPHPGEHLHEGGLAGAVLAADGVDLATP